jgi:hypothetical protein
LRKKRPDLDQSLRVPSSSREKDTMASDEADSSDVSSQVEVLDVMATYMYPVLRLVAALGVVWFASGVSK